MSVVDWVTGVGLYGCVTCEYDGTMGPLVGCEISGSGIVSVVDWVTAVVLHGCVTWMELDGVSSTIGSLDGCVVSGSVSVSVVDWC